MRSLLLLSIVLLASLGYAAAPGSPKVPELIAVLKSDAPQKEKADACRELARVGNSQAVAALAALLPDERLSHMARYALETIPSSAADKALRNALAKTSNAPLVGVITSIGVRRDSRAVPALARHLRDSNPQVASAAARALGNIGNSAAAKALTQALPNVPASAQLPICEGLLRCAERFAASGQQQSALKVYDGLRKLPQAHQVRTAAWRGAILSRGDNGLPLLLEALRTNDFLLFDTAVRCAHEMPGKPVTLALAHELPQLSTDEQVILIQLLGERGDTAALPALLAAAAHHDPGVCVAALNALASIGSRPGPHPDITRSILPVFTALLFHSNPVVAQAAQNALAALPDPAADEAVLAMLGPGNNLPHRLKALDLIARRRIHSAVPQLFTLAEGQDPVLRVAALKRLGELADPAQLPELLNVLTRATEPGDIEAAEQSLAAVSQRAPDPEQWAERLQNRWESSMTPQRCAMVRVFSAIGGTNALRAIRSAASNSVPEVRMVSIRALGSWTNTEASGALLELARDAGDPNDRALALHTCLEVAAQSEIPAANRLALCRDAASLVKTDDQKKLLLAALGDLPSAEALELITPLLAEPGLKDESCTAALNVSDKVLKAPNPAPHKAEVTKALEQVLQAEPKPELRKRAEKLLEQTKGKNGNG